MAKHEFGIMPNTPGNERYDNYEPEKYNLVSVDDKDIEKISEELDDISCYWHTLCRPENNLAYCGITLIPPKSQLRFIEIFKRHDKGQYRNVIDIFEQASRENKYIIHYGL
jgi:hypothetical protein